MRRRWILLLPLIAIGLPVLAALGLVSYANSGAGRRFIEREVAERSGGTVRIAGLAGSLPGEIRLARIELADQDGPWATVEDAALHWSPAALLRGEASIGSLSARHVALLRRPVPQAGGSAGGSGLPVRVSLRHLAIARLDLAEPVLGAPASLAIDGSADLSSLWRSRADLAVRRLDGEGDYKLHVVLDGAGSQVGVEAREPAGGLLARLADLPDLGGLHLTATMTGPPDGEKIAFQLMAGPLSGEGHGTADLKRRRLDLDIGVRSPAMAPRPGLSWQSARLEAHVHGAFEQPEAEGHLAIDGIASGGSGLDRIEADLRGKEGKLDLSARLIGLHPKGVPPTLLGAAPVELTAQTTLTGRERPVEFALSHPLLRAQGKTALSEGAAISVEATLPDLAALAPLTGLGIQGRATLKGHYAANGEISLEGRVEKERELLHLAAEGTIADKIDLRWSVEAADMAKLGAPVPGAVTAKGSLEGSATGFSATAEAEGRLAEAPMTLSVKVERSGDGATRIAIDRARWKSVQATGSLDLAPKTGRASGSLQAKAGDLGDFSAFAGIPLTGSAEASLRMAQGRTPRAVIHADVRQAGWPSGALGHLQVEGSVEDPLGHPVTALRLSAEQIRASDFTGSAALSAEGPESALKLTLSADLQGPRGPASVTAESVAALPKKTLRLSSLQASYAGETARLMGPATIAYGGPVKVGGLRLGIGPGEIDIDGQAAPELALDLSIKQADLAHAERFVPSFKASGTLSAEAHLRGDPAAPQGDVHVSGRDLRWGGMARLALDGRAHLQGGAASVEVRLDSGKRGALTVAGSVPLQGDGDLDLSAKGSLDLAILESFLAAEGREARGKVTLDASVSGSLAEPVIAGGAELHGVSLQDYAQGLHLSDIAGKLMADKGVLRLSGVSGRAGPGRFTLEGTVGILRAGIPLDLTLTARNARPLASDLLTADMDADLKLDGTVAGGLALVGKIKVNRAEINIPENLPPTVATLKVVKKGAPPPPPPSLGVTVALDVGVDAPEQIFVRGRGVDAEMGGRLHVGGTIDDPQIEGGFDLRRGTYNLAGQTMTVTRGRIGFDGGGPGGKLDPALDLAVESASNGIDATLRVTGYADTPVLKLSSSPDLPQDEILARLLFNESVSQLTPLQLASIAQGVAQMSGVGGGFDPLAMLRKHLGIDRLSVSSSGGGAEGNANTMVEAGKYVATGIYVGTRQGLNGGTQARVQIDLTRHLKLDTVIGTGGGAPAIGTTIDNDPGSSIGLTWQFDY